MHFMSIRSLPNPHWPLQFERLSGEYKDKDLEHDDMGSNIALETSTLSMAGGAEAYSCKDAAKVYKATVLALEAHGYNDSQKAVKCAREALAVSPICPEAYNVLALHDAQDYEGALNTSK